MAELKIVIHFRRKPGISVEEFDEYWEKQHGPLVTRIFPKMTRYVQIHHYSTALPEDSPLVDRVEGGNILRRDPTVDGIAEIYFNSLEDWITTYNEVYLNKGGAGDELRNDEHKFVDMSSIRFFLGREVVIKEKGG